jgi:hypothetical protein
MIAKRKEQMRKNTIHKSLNIEQCENVSGDNILNCQNTANSYLIFGSKDCAYCYDAGDLKDCWDVAEPYKGELEYETHACNINYNILFTSKCFENKNLIYCQYCWFCDHCFGCFGLRNKEYCILNKQYTKEEYETLVAKILEKMQADNERGEFFDYNMSPFGYNETIAYEYYPLTREEALKQ